MQILNKIKFNYQLKLLNSYLNVSDYETFIFDLKKNLHNNHEIYRNLYKHFIKTITNNNNLNYKKIFWLNSFCESDTNILTQFFNYYFDKNPFDYSIAWYHEILTEINKTNLSFSQLIENAHFSQFTYCLSSENNNLFIKNNLPFYISNSQDLFTTKNLTTGFIFLVRNPYDIYFELKNNFNNATEAINAIVGHEHYVKKINNQNSFFIEEIRKDWRTHLESWTDEKVVSNFNGLIIKYEDLVGKPHDSLFQILSYLKEQNENIQIDLNQINSFIIQHKKLFIKNQIPKFSNKEVKQIDHKIYDINEKYYYKRNSD